MRVNTEELLRQSEALYNTAFRLDALLDEVLHIKGSLEQEVTSGKFEAVLRSTANVISQQQQDLKKLGAGLEEISQLYEQFENAIADHAQDSQMRIQSIGYKVIPIIHSGVDDITDMLDWTAWDP